MRRLLSFAQHTLSGMAASLLGIDFRPFIDELRSLDAVPCSHCGLTDHSGLLTDADWAAARELGTFGGGA